MDEEGQLQVCSKGSTGDQSMATETQSGTETNEELQTKDLQDQIEKLSLADQERRRIVRIEEDDIRDINRDFTNMTACKILSNKTINQEMFMDKIPRIWGLEGRVTIEKEGRNLYLCKFGNQRDKNRVTKGGPWSFDSNLLVFDEPKGNTCLSSLSFRYTFFWIHFHGLPRVCYCRKYAEALGNSIGVFESVEVNE